MLLSQSFLVFFFFFCIWLSICRVSLPLFSTLSTLANNVTFNFFKLGEMLFPFHVFHLGNTNIEITFETLSGNLMARKQGKSES